MTHQPGSFPPILLSRLAHHAMLAVENAAMEVEAAHDLPSTHLAYSRLNMAREQLATHIARLEEAARKHGALGINPTVSVRYR